MVQTEPWSFFIAKKPLVVRRLFCSWDFLLVLRHLVSSIPEPVGSWESFFYSVFPPLAGSFLRPFSSVGCDWCSLCSVSTGCCLTGSVLCSSFSQFSFSFSANVCWGPGGVISLWAPCEFSFVFCGSCSLLSTFVFSFLCLSQWLWSRIFQWDLAFGLQCSHFFVSYVQGVFVSLILRYVFFLKVIEPIFIFYCVAVATLTPRHYHWACF